MGYVSLAMQRLLWLIYRLFGLGCLVLALHYTSITLQLDRNFVPRSEQAPYFAICLALFSGTLFLLPSTTPLWVKSVQDTVTATAAIAAMVAMAMALAAGTPMVLPLLTSGPTESLAQAVSAAINLVTAAGVLTAGFLGLTAQRRKGKAVPLMAQAASDQCTARQLRNSRA